MAADGAAAVAALGDLRWRRAVDAPELLAPPVAAALAGLPGSGQVLVAEIDPAVADTAALVAAHRVAPQACGNCVVVLGRRGQEERVAACVVPASTRADVNGAVRRRLDARKASFMPHERAVAETGMEHGGITPLGLPEGWLLLLDAAVAALNAVVVGSGVRRSKLAVPGAVLAQLPGAEVVEGLGTPGGASGDPGG